MKVHNTLVPPSYFFLQNAPARPPALTFSYIVHFADPDTLRTLCLMEKRNLYDIARDFLRRTVTAIVRTDQIPKPNLSSFDSERLSAMRSLSIVVDRYFDVYLLLFVSVFGFIIDTNHVCVSGASGPFIRSILENTKAFLVILESDRYYAEPQDFVDMVHIVIRDLRISR
ncbi:hypothetical protein IW261DRAFT_475088 [Armillaria novae-zelandiae]|uniref:Uncharacterized protein n=1 Tax=Armillaria novae-zelandiae TaxID=153914 RepID=A0AA39P0N5_9AGAR|nr:hypothetical protein IW261DRAFT_475088 [Armillaria novae-zelandiae]